MVGIAVIWASGASAACTVTGWRSCCSFISPMPMAASRIICSDEKWRAARGPIQMSDIYMGETYDARREKPGWDETL